MKSPKIIIKIYLFWNDFFDLLINLESLFTAIVFISNANLIIRVYILYNLQCTFGWQFDTYLSNSMTYWQRDK